MSFQSDDTDPNPDNSPTNSPLYRFQVTWEDGEDDCTHCAVFESPDQDPDSAAYWYLVNLGINGWFEIVSVRSGISESIGHKY